MGEIKLLENNVFIIPIIIHSIESHSPYRPPTLSIQETQVTLYL